jgi:hypothetical protein
MRTPVSDSTALIVQAGPPVANAALNLPVTVPPPLRSSGG